MNLHMLKSENEEQFIWRLGQAKDNGLINMSWDEIADIVNRELGNEDRPLSEAAFRKPYSNAKKYFEAGVFDSTKKVIDLEKQIEELKANNSEMRINKDGSYSSNKLLEMNEYQSKDPDYILEAHGFDKNVWKIVSARNSVRQVISKQDGIVTLYASYITVKPMVDLTTEQIDKFYESLLIKYQSPVIKSNLHCESGFLLEVPIVDLHFGKLSRSEDVSEPYNFELARERFNYIIDDVIQNVSNLDIEKIIFPIGSDYFHVDTVNATTTAGTQQTTDLSPQLIFRYGLECLIDGITKLSQIAPVECFCVNGNHDFLTSYHAICSLWCYFHNNENVTVNKDTSPRKYVEFGKNLIGFAHGDKEKKRIDGIMQIEAREAWGRTLFHEFHLGHLHSEQIRENNGVIIRHLSSVTGTDMWHHNSGYVGAIKKSQSFLWDKEYGLKSIINTVIK